MLISSNFASQTRWSIFALGLQIHQAAPALSNISIFYLYDNQLSGTIPEELGNLKSIIDIDLSINRLNGIVPISLGNLSKLEWLSLYNNQFSGLVLNR